MRLIDADALMGRFKKLEKRFGAGASGDGIGLCMEELFRADTIDPKQGEWIDTGEAIGDDIEVKCSLCGEELYWLANFCPNCGARMKEGDEK